MSINLDEIISSIHVAYSQEQCAASEVPPGVAAALRGLSAAELAELQLSPSGRANLYQVASVLSPEQVALIVSFATSPAECEESLGRFIPDEAFREFAASLSPRALLGMHASRLTPEEFSALAKEFPGPAFERCEPLFTSEQIAYFVLHQPELVLKFAPHRIDVSELDAIALRFPAHVTLSSKAAGFVSLDVFSQFVASSWGFYSLSNPLAVARLTDGEFELLARAHGSTALLFAYSRVSDSLFAELSPLFPKEAVSRSSHRLSDEQLNEFAHFSPMQALEFAASRLSQEALVTCTRLAPYWGARFGAPYFSPENFILMCDEFPQQFLEAASEFMSPERRAAIIDEYPHAALRCMPDALSHGQVLVALSRMNPSEPAYTEAVLAMTDPEFDAFCLSNPGGALTAGAGRISPEQAQRAAAVRRYEDVASRAGYLVGLEVDESSPEFVTRPVSSLSIQDLALLEMVRGGLLARGVSADEISGVLASSSSRVPVRKPSSRMMDETPPGFGWGG